MAKKSRRMIGLTLASMILLAGCGTQEVAGGATTKSSKSESSSKVEKSKEPIVLTYACTNREQKDPYFKDAVTGEYVMAEEDREIYIQVLEEIKEELNVEVQFVPIPGYIWEVLLQSVLAGDPIADIVDLEINSQGRILAQNVIQPLDNYLDLLGDNPSPKIYGKHFFLESAASGEAWSLSPLVYNIDYIEAVEALKVDGKTVYPTDLYKDGKWTWSTFEEYLKTIDAHYANSQAPERPEYRIDAFRTEYTETIIEAIHSNGGAIYGNEGLQIETPEVKQAVEYVEGLMSKGLLKANITEGTSSAPWASHATNFELGETVFTEIEDWRLGSAAAKATERGQSLGFIPFPRPDHMAVDDPGYRPSVTKGGSTIIPKGLAEEKIPLAIQTYNLFYEKAAKAKAKRAEESNEEKGIKTLNGTDIFHPEIGQDIAEIYNQWTSPVNEYSIMVGVYWNFMQIAGDAIWGVDGSPRFSIAFESRKNEITDKIASVEALLNTDEIKDNIVPAFTQVTEGEVFVVPVGIDPATINWAQKFTAKDNLDGQLDITTANFDTTLTDFNTVGEYQDGMVATINDSSGNTGKGKYRIFVYEAGHKESPIITLKEEYRTIKVDEDTAKINWNDFVESAVDKDGLNIKSNLVADLGGIDTTTKGEYDVELTVTDFTGNTAQTMLKVKVE